MVAPTNTKDNASKFDRKSLAIGIFICALGALFYCYEYLLRIQPSFMNNQLREQFGLSGQSLGILVGLYYWAYSPMQIAVGLLTDIYGPRKMLTLAVAVCTIGSFMFGYTHNLYIAGLGRFLIGFGSAFAFVGVLKLGAIWLPSNWFAMFAGLATALGMVGALVGDMQLTLLINSIGWRETILVSTVFGVVLTPFIWLAVRDVHPHDPPVEERVNFTEGIAGIKEIAKNPQIWLAGLVGCALYMSLSVFAEEYGIDFLANVHGFDIHTASASNGAVFLGWLVGAPLFGFISDRLRSRRWPIFVGALVAIALMLVIIYLPSKQAVSLVPIFFGYSVKFINIVLFFFGLFCSAEIICFAIGRENCPDHMAGSAVAFINMLVMLGGAVFQPLFGSLLDLGWTGKVTASGLHLFDAQVYQEALLMIPIAIGLAAFGVLFIKETAPRKVADA